jgi:dTDP-4-amino-4,6-dideoxygalactose transaminase
MIDPALAIGSQVQLYHLTEDLAPDLATLLPMLANRDDQPRALLVSHFFGMVQSLDRIAAACREHRVSLIEDCSHALPRGMTPGAPRSVGEVGDFGVASPYKFFPCPDGGLLWSNRRALPPRVLRPAGWRFELRKAAGSVRALVSRSLPLTGGFARAQPTLPSGTPEGRVWEEASIGPSDQYDQREESTASLRVSRCIVSHTDVPRLVSRRRANYQRWVDRVQGLRHCRALFPTLHGDCAPYMFALLLERPESDFLRLKSLGVPIWRWDEMARSECPVARRYRMALIHLPCHQSLRRAELDWMTSSVERVCSSSVERSLA